MGWVYVVGFLAVLFGFGAFFGAPYVPTKRRDVRRMFESLYPLSDKDVLLDIGSGDGLVLRAAREKGARAVGYEINPVFYGLSRLLSAADPGVRVRLVNAWLTPFPDDVTVIYIFSTGKDGKRLERLMQKEADRLQRPLTLVCYGNPLPRIPVHRSFEAYSLYIFQPLHRAQP